MSMAFYRYVPHSRVDDFTAVGWEDLGLVPGHHGIYSCRMKWEGEGDPPDPEPLSDERSAQSEEMSPTQKPNQAAFQTQGQAGGMQSHQPAKMPPSPSAKAMAIFHQAYEASLANHYDIAVGTFWAASNRCDSDLERKFLAAAMFMDVAGNSYGGPLLCFEDGHRFVIEPQKQCGDYTIDFAFTMKEGAWFSGQQEVRVAVEIDGAYWHDRDPKRIERDRARDRFLSLQGWRVVRFSEREIEANAHACAKQVKELFETIAHEQCRHDIAQGEAAA